MGITDEPEPQSAWFWPAEWAVERGFWREVATRTLAGVLTVVIIGVPTLVWAGINGALRWETVAPILVGIAMFVLLVIIYVAVLVSIRRRERRKIEAALALEKYISEILPDPKMLANLDPAQRARLMESISEAGKAKLAEATRSARALSVGSFLALLVGIVASALTTTQVTDILTGIFRP